MVLPAASPTVGCENALDPSGEILLTPRVHSPMGVYPQSDGTTSTWHQESGAAPSGHPAPAVSSCTTYQSAQLYAATATPIATGSTTAPGSSQTGTGTRTALTSQTSSSAALRSVNTDFGLLACLTALVGTALGSLVILV